MGIRAYTADSNNKIRNASNAYAAAGAHIIRASDNIADVLFTQDDASEQQALYTSISFGSNMTSIPARCCYLFTNLKSVSFAGNRIVSIGDEAFCSCQSLQYIRIPSNVSRIGQRAFAECSQLTAVMMQSTYPIDVGSNAFAGSALKSLSITAGSNTSPNAFSYCTELQQASVDGVLVDQMFSGCTSLESVHVKCNTTSVPQGCFTGCSKLSSVVFDSIDELTALNDNAFYGCNSLTSFSLNSTNAKSLGSNVFNGTNVQSLQIPASITSLSQISPSFLQGSNVTHVKLLGMTAKYMESIKEQFTAFGAPLDTMTIESQDGKSYKVDQNGLIIPESKVYIISIAISNNLQQSPLEGMFHDTSYFIDMIRKAYDGKESLIAGITRLNDLGTIDSNGIGDVKNLDDAFEEAERSKADFLIFHFSDHGGGQAVGGFGHICLYNGNYSYPDLYAKFQKFKYVFAMFCCCYPNSVDDAHKFTPGPKNTRALFWCAGKPDETTYMMPGLGHLFMNLLKENFNRSFSWKQQWDVIDVKYGTGNRIPVQYVYGDFPTSSKVFMVEN